MQHPTPLEAAAVAMPLLDIENELLMLHCQSPRELDGDSVLTVPYDLDRAIVEGPRRLSSPTSEIFKLARCAVQVQNRARAGAPAVCLYPVHDQHLALRVGLDPYREAFRLPLSRERRSRQIDGPSSEGRLRTGRDGEQQGQQNGLHAATMLEICSRNKEEQVVKRCYTFHIVMKIRGIL